MTDRPDTAAPPVFLERQTYRRRRMTDAARLLPLLGIGLFAIPLLWPRAGNSSLTEPVSTSGATLYIFLAWAFLIVASAFLGGRMRGDSGSEIPDNRRNGGSPAEEPR